MWAEDGREVTAVAVGVVVLAVAVSGGLCKANKRRMAGESNCFRHATDDDDDDDEGGRRRSKISEVMLI